MNKAHYYYITIIIFILFAGINYSANAECDNCGIPSVLEFDFTVTVPQPPEGPMLWEWLNLFNIADAANSALFNSNNNMCIIYRSGEMTLTGKLVRSNKRARTFTAPPGKIDTGDDYLVTGEVSRIGDGYQVSMSLETTCSRKKVLSASVPFTVTQVGKPIDYRRDWTIDDYLNGRPEPDQPQLFRDGTDVVKELVRDNFTPLLPKIREFGRKLRDTDTRVAIDATYDDSLVMEPAKRHARPNETVPITFTLKDCDDEPLRNRVISFTSSSRWGIDSSQNGRFNTTTATTDDSGKVTVDYKVGTYPGASTARAYFEYLRPSGCEMAGYNEAVINVDGARQYHGKATFTSPVAETTGVAEVTWTLIDKPQEKDESALGDDYSDDEDADTNDEEQYSGDDTGDDELEYEATGTIKGVVKVPDCDPLQVELPIKSSPDGELAINYTEKTYRFEFSSDTEITLMCGKPRRPWVISGASVFHYSGGLCAEPAGIDEGSSPEDIMKAISGMKLGVPYDNLKTFKGEETCHSGMFGTTKWEFEAVM